MTNPPPEPSWRQPAGIFLILALIALWGFLIASLAEIVGGWPVLVQALFYLVTGLLWVAPLKPLLRWMEGGRTRPHSPPGGDRSSTPR